MRSPSFRRAVALLLLTSLSLLSACTRPRIGGPRSGDTYRLPWGASPVARWDKDAENEFQASLTAALRRRLEAVRAANPEGRLPYRVLSLSGGGSRGAYGAGVLLGWTARGDRPEFDVVTGISTGALMSTFAFLGPEHDPGLLTYRDVRNRDIYYRYSLWTLLREDSAFDTRPLAALLERIIPDDLIDLVAVEHSKGRRLFIGTTNLDAQAFVVWEMGAIAASERPDRYKRYREVVLASASFPIAFPPVYIEVEREDGSTYTQMHVDGGARETVFFHDFVDEYLNSVRKIGLDPITDIEADFYLLNNGTIYARAEYKPVNPTTLSVAGATVASLMRKATLGSLYRMWVLTLSAGANFHITYIPPEVELQSNPLEFGEAEMNMLFELGYASSVNGEAWRTQAAPTSQDELLLLINPRTSVDRLEQPPWLRDDVE